MNAAYWAEVDALGVYSGPTNVRIVYTAMHGVVFPAFVKFSPAMGTRIFIRWLNKQILPRFSYWRFRIPRNLVRWIYLEACAGDSGGFDSRE